MSAGAERPGRGRIGKDRDTHATRAEITRAALAIIDQEGMAALTMRRLGAEVHLTARALYNHFEGRGDVITSVVDLLWDDVIAEIWTTAPASTEWIVHGLLCIRRVFLAHPEVALYIAAAPERDQRLIDSIEAFTQIMAISDFDQKDRAFHLLMQFTIGSIVTASARRLTTAELGRDEDGLRDWMREHIGGIDRPRTERARIAKALLPETHEALFEQELRFLAASLRRDAGMAD